MYYPVLSSAPQRHLSNMETKFLPFFFLPFYIYFPLFLRPSFVSHFPVFLPDLSLLPYFFTSISISHIVFVYLLHSFFISFSFSVPSFLSSFSFSLSTCASLLLFFFFTLTSPSSFISSFLLAFFLYLLISSPLSLFLCQSLFFTFFLYHCSSSCFSVPQPSVAGHPKSLLLHCSNSGSKCSVPKVRHFSIIFIYTLGRIGD